MNKMTCYIYSGSYFKGKTFYLNSSILISNNGWVNEEQDILADFSRVFGEVTPEAGRVATMTDTDNTGTDATAWYSDSTFRTRSFMSYPEDIRKSIYTTNAIESLNMKLRKVTKNRGHFPSDEAMFKLIYLPLKNIEKKWTMPIRDWKSALNQFSILFDGSMQHH